MDEQQQQQHPEAAREKELEGLREELARERELREGLLGEVSSMKEELAGKQEAVEGVNDKPAAGGALGEVKRAVETRLKNLRDQHEREMEECRRQKDELQSTHERRVQELEAKAAKATRGHQADLRSVEEEAVQARDRLQKELDEHYTAVGAQLDASNEALKNSQNELKTARFHHQSAIAQQRDDYEVKMKEMKDRFDKTHELNRIAFDKRLTDVEARASGNNSPSAADTEDLQRRVASLQAQLEKTGSDHAQTLSEKEELEYKISRLRATHNQEISVIEEQHEASLAAALANADDELEERMRAQSNAHNKQFDDLHERLNGELQNLQIQLEEAADLRHTQMQAAETERERLLGELGEKLKGAEQTSSALQARLDAELTTRGETERSLAEMRRQRFEDDKRSAESRDVLQQQIAALETQKNALAMRAEAIPTAATEDLADLVSAEEPATPRDGPDVAALASKLAAAQRDCEEALKSVKEEKKEKAELARQNEFLVQNMESMMANSVVPVKQPPAPSTSDASAQTEPVRLVDETATKLRRRDSDLYSSPEDAKRGRSQRPLTPESQNDSSEKLEDDQDNFDESELMQNGPQAQQPALEIVEALQSATRTVLERSPSNAKRKSLLPKLTSTPRTPTSIPKAVPFPGNRASINIPSQLHKPGQSISNRSSHLRQQSNISPEPSPQRRSVLGNHRMSQQIKPPAAADFAPERNSVYSGGSGPSPEPVRPDWSKKRSYRHSSVNIYGGWQAIRET